MIELKDERYTELIVEVADPKAVVELVKTALPRLIRCAAVEFWAKTEKICATANAVYLVG